MTSPIRLTLALALLLGIGLVLLPSCRSRCCPQDAPIDSGEATSGSASDDTPAEPAPRPRRRINAQALYGRRCATCHGMTGGGGKGPRLVGRGALRKFKTRAELSAFVLENMPPTGARLDQDQADALAAFAFRVNNRR